MTKKSKTDRRQTKLDIPAIERELSTPATLNRAYEMIIESGAKGMTFTEILFALYPDLRAHEADHLADILKAEFRRAGRLAYRDRYN